MISWCWFYFLSRGSENRLSVGLQEYKDLPQISKKCRVKHCDLQASNMILIIFLKLLFWHLFSKDLGLNEK